MADSSTSSRADSARGQLHPASPLIALVIECTRPLAGSAAWSLGSTTQVQIGRGSPRGAAVIRGHLRVDVPDSTLSTHHASVCLREGKWWLQDAGSKNGTLLNGRRVDSAALQDGDFFELGTCFFVFRDSDQSAWTEASLTLSPEATDEAGLQTFNGPLRNDYLRLVRVARSQVPVMVLGETGTGKELVARAVHAMSKRPGEFVAVNCAALSEGVLESELFGHRKGAFSGASESRPGLVRGAHGGTLFLDEVGELPSKSQAKLLRVLQEGEVHPLGETRPVPVDVRVVAATHQNLVAKIGHGGFRDDFYGRLAGYELTLPPLRQRTEDLGLLIQVLLRRIAGAEALGMVFQPEAARALFTYEWPRNIREFELALAAAAALTDDGKLRREYLPGLVRKSTHVRPAPAPADTEAEMKRRLAELLQLHQGNVSAVARQLGKARVQVRRWCKRFAIDPDSFRV